MNGDPAADRIGAIRLAIEEVRQERVRSRLPGLRASPQARQGGTGRKGRAARLFLVGPLLRWVYGLVKAPSRIRDLLTLIRLAELNAGRSRRELHAMVVALEEAQAELRAEQAATGEVAAGLLTRAGVVEQRAESLEAGLGGLAERLAAAEDGAAGTHARIAKVDKALAALEREEQLTRARRQAATRRQDEVAALYDSLEERFRGSRALVRERQGIYLPTIKELQVEPEGLPVVDLGCGRGEWLEILKAAAIPGRGVDSNPAMVTACRGAGLQVEELAAAEFLAAQPGASARGVTCFHLLEHMAPPDWIHLVREAWRVLAPGGVAIFETPNPENLLVAGSDFYLDPTHVRPIPSRLLLFVAEQSGFSRCRIMELHPRESCPPPQDHGEGDLLRRHLQGPQDYALLGWKPQPASS